MLVSEVNQELVGKRIACIVTGLQCVGVVTSIEEDEYTMNVNVELDVPVQWGEQKLTTNSFFGRKCDGWGSLVNCVVVNDPAVEPFQKGNLVQYKENMGLGQQGIVYEVVHTEFQAGEGWLVTIQDENNEDNWRDLTQEKLTLIELKMK